MTLSARDVCTTFWAVGVKARGRVWGEEEGSVDFVPEPLFVFRFLVKLCSPETTPAWLQAELNRGRSIVERVAYNDTLSAIHVVLAYSKSIFIRSAKYLNMCDVM